MFWVMLAISLALWILQFGFGVEQWYVPTLNAILWVLYLIRLRKNINQDSIETAQKSELS
jgi:fatty acid desaturase